MAPVRVVPPLVACLLLAGAAVAQPPPAGGPPPAGIRASIERLGSLQGLVEASPSAGSESPAQGASARWGDLYAAVGDTVRVVRLDHTEVNGTLRSMSDYALDVEQKGELVRVLRPDISVVQRQASDPVLNGVLIGAAAGFLGGMAAEGVIMDGIGGETGFPDSGTWTVAAIGGGLGGLFGGASDAKKHQHVTVYRAER